MLSEQIRKALEKMEQAAQDERLSKEVAAQLDKILVCQPYRGRMGEAGLKRGGIVIDLSPGEFSAAIKAEIKTIYPDKTVSSELINEIKRYWISNTEVTMSKPSEEEADEMGDQIMDHLSSKYYVLRQHNNSPRVLSRANASVSNLLSSAPLHQCISDFIIEKTGQMVDPREVKEYAEQFLMSINNLDEEPKQLTLKDDPAVSYRQIPYDIKEGPLGPFNDFLWRLSDQDAFCAFIGAVVDLRYTGRQALWLHGAHGKDGKSTMVTVMRKVLGQALQKFPPKASSMNQFATARFAGARLIVHANCLDRFFFRCEQFLTLTGGDGIIIEPKGLAAYDYLGHFCVWANSNWAPIISGSSADVSRLLYIKVSKAKENTGDAWEKSLIEHLPAFLYHCQAMYAAKCKDHYTIETSDKTKALVADLTTGDVEQSDIYSNYIAPIYKLDPKGSVTTAEIESVLHANKKFDKYAMSTLSEWMERELAVTRVKDGNFFKFEGLRRLTLAETIALEGTARDTALSYTEHLYRALTGKVAQDSILEEPIPEGLPPPRIEGRYGVR